MLRQTENPTPRKASGYNFLEGRDAGGPETAND